MKTTNLQSIVPNGHVFVTSYRKYFPLLLLSEIFLYWTQIVAITHLEDGEGRAGHEDDDVGDGEVDQQHVDQALEVTGGRHGQADQDVANEASEDHDAVDHDQDELVAIHLRRKDFANHEFCPLTLLECSKGTLQSHPLANKASCCTGNSHSQQEVSSSSRHKPHVCLIYATVSCVFTLLNG